MPLIQQWDARQHGRAAIWEIQEPEAFFGNAGLNPDITHDKRRLEHLAGRYLLQQLEPDVEIEGITPDEHGKPRIPDNELFFSISHSWPYVAVMTDPFGETGVDIQVWHPRIEALQDKFLAPEEQTLFTTNQLRIVAWSAKEAVYKWHGRKGIDLIRDLPVEYFALSGNKSEMVIYSKLSKVPQMIFIESIITTDFACSYVIRAQDWAIY